MRPTRYRMILDGNLLRQERKRRRMTQKQLAEMAGISRRTLCYWEKKWDRFYRVFTRTVYGLSDAFGIPTPEFFEKFGIIEKV